MKYVHFDNTGRIISYHDPDIGAVPTGAVEITESQWNLAFEHRHTHYIGGEFKVIVPTVVHTAQSLRKRLDKAIVAVEESMFLDKLGYLPSVEGLRRNVYLYDLAVAGKAGVNEDIIAKYKPSMDAYRSICILGFSTMTIVDLHITRNDLSSANNIIVKYIADNPT